MQDSLSTWPNIWGAVMMGTSSNFGNGEHGRRHCISAVSANAAHQILLNNFLYDLAQVTIPTAHVNETFLRKPRRWNIDVLRRFTVWGGSVSSIYDLVIFYALSTMFGAVEMAFDTGWFVESLATHTLVLFVIRTGGNPLKSRPSFPLTATTVLIVAFGILLPYTRFAEPLGFVPLSLVCFGFLAGITMSDLALVELVKRRLLRGSMD